MTNPSPDSPSILSRIGYFFFRYRNGLFPVIYLIIALFIRPTLFLGQETLDLVMTGIGVVCALAGGLVRILTIGLVYIRRGGRNRRVSADDLVTDGIYAHVRNPMYLGNLLIAAGLSLMYGSPWIYAGLFPLFLLIYISIVAEEERFLTTKFGDEFTAYCRSVPRFWPNFHRVYETVGNYRFNWKRVIKKEYGTTCALLTAVYILGLSKYWYLHGMHQGQAVQPVQALPLLVLLAAYLGALFFKKTRRI